MGRGGHNVRTEEPERRCVATGEVHPRRGLIRFAMAPDGGVVPDVAGKLPGRGVWVSAEHDALEQAVLKNLFSRGFKTQARVSDSLVADTEAALLRRVVDGISLSRKAGKAIAGFEKVKDWLVKEEARLLFQASDGSERGKAKLRPPGGRGSFFDILTASELGLSFGREHVIHAALAAGGLTDRVRDDAVRLSGVRENGGGTTT
ncbi:MAG: RNA-binding protein [Pseudomonadota bacterium]